MTLNPVKLSIKFKYHSPQNFLEKNPVIDTLPAQGQEAKERTRDIPLSLGWLALGFCFFFQTLHPVSFYLNHKYLPPYFQNALRKIISFESSRLFKL